MVPARQRLEADDAARLDMHLRLEVQRELARLRRDARDRLAQCVFHFQALAGRLVHACRVELVIVPAGILGVVHRGIGIAQHGLAVAPVTRENADPDTRRRIQRVRPDLVAVGKGTLQLAGDAGRSQRRIDVGQHDGEFVAAQPCHDVAGAHRLAQARRDQAQQVVADVVAERVVDILETIEVDQHQRDLAVVARTGLQGELKLRLEGQAIRQMRQRIVIGEMRQAVGRLLALADVGKAGDVIERAAGCIADH